MGRLAALCLMGMGAAWLGATCLGRVFAWLRWPALAATVAALALARAMHASRVVVPPVAVPLALVGAYGVCLSAFSRMPTFALVKCLAFVATVVACVWGGAHWVERWGRDAVIRTWRSAWLLFLALAVGGVLLGRWDSGPEGMYGFGVNPNQFASLVGTFGLVLLLPLRAPRWRLTVEASVAVGLILASRSRTSIAAAAAAAMVALAVGRGWTKWAIAAAPVLVAGVAFLFLPEQSLAQVHSVADAENLEGLFHSRRSNWEESWVAMKDGLPYGAGWGVKADSVRRTWNWDNKSFGREEGTSWLPIGEELGLPGFALFAWIWIAVVRSANVAFLRPAALGGVAFFLVMATFEGWLLAPGCWESFAFWTFVGIVMARPRAAFAPVPVPFGFPETALATSRAAP